MILISRIMLGIILAVVAHNVVGNQRIVHVSELITGTNNLTRDEDNSSSSICCVYGNCSCTSLNCALDNLGNNVLINITTDVVLSMSLLTQGSNLENISIIGYNSPTVYCKRHGHIHFTSCHNCIIQGITWDGCGTSNGESGLEMSSSSNITIQNCSFQHSTGKAVVLSEVRGDININHCKFINNSLTKGHGAALYYSIDNSIRNFSQFFTLRIKHCNFNVNKGVESIVYIENRNTKHTNNVILQSSTFHANRGVSVYVANQNLRLNGKVLFQNNTARSGAGIYIINNSTVTFCENSNVTFSQNVVDDKGGAVFINDHSNILFDHNSIVTFNENKAKFGAIYSNISSNVTFKATSQVLFSANSATERGGAIFSSDNCHVIFAGLSKVTFSSNVIHNFDNATSGGAIYSKHIISFEENSTAVFNENLAEYGGAIYSKYLSFEGYSKTVFSKDTANNGGAIHTDNDGYISFKGNSTSVFHNNTASNCGGAAVGTFSNITFDDNSTVTFTNNKATCGVTVYSNGISKIMMKENPTVIFDNQVAKWCANTCLRYNGQSDVVAIDNTGTIRCSNQKAFICLSKKCHCNNLEDMLVSLKDHALVNITDTVTLSSVVSLNYLNSISIIGHKNPTVYCVNDSGLTITHSKSVLIEGINWIGCGNNKANANPVLYFQVSCDITIQNCIFQHSIGQAVALSEVWGYVDINHCNFVSNTHYRGHGAAIHYSLNYKAECVLKINGCSFSYNGITKSVVYIGHTYYKLHERICLSNSSFYNNQGVSVYLSNHLSLHITGEVSFKHNVAKNGAAIYVSDQSTVIFGKNSTVKFVNNSVHRRGAAIFLSSYTLLSFDENSIATFNDNNGINGTIYTQANSNVIFKATCQVTFSRNTASQYGAAIYSSDNSHVTFTGNATVTFNKNIVSPSYNDEFLWFGGTILSLTNSYISFEENSVTTFSNNVAEFGAAISLFYKSSITFKGRSRVTLNDNTANKGGAVALYDKCTAIFKEYSDLTFSNNEARQSGGALYFLDHSDISFMDNSRVTFDGNTANNGGAIALHNKCSATTNKQSSLTFRNNFGKRSGGALHFSDNSHFSITDNSVTVLNDNKANNGGAIALYNKCTATIKKYSNLTFSNNRVGQSGGALYFSDHSIFSYTDNSVILFSNNSAKDYGGALYSKVNSSVKFEESSTLSFKSNRALFGETLYSIGNSDVTMTSNVMINNNRATWNYGGQFINESIDITIDANGVVSCSDHKEYYVAIYKRIFCTNIKDIPSNSVVTITENMILSSTTQLTKLVNISLIGYNSSSINCENDGGLEFVSCSSVTITDIIWTGSINKESNTSYNIPRLKFYESSNIKISNCTFQHLAEKALLLSKVSGNVNIKHCKFMNNKNIEHGGAIHYLSNCTKYSNNQLTISDCDFSHNFCTVIFLESLSNNSRCENIVLQNSEFNNNQGVCIYLSNENLDIKGNVLFKNNVAENGPGIFVNHHSNVTFGNTSNVKFAHNAADISGGALYLNNWSNVLFKSHSHVLFSNNKAGNAGGNIYLYNNSGITFKGNSMTWFNYSTANFGGNLYAEKYSFVVTKGRSMLTISNNEAKYGGATYITHKSKMAITENSKIMFLNNEAKADGGSIYSDFNSSILFKGDSIMTSINNKATQGGVIYSKEYSKVKFVSNSMAIFNRNEATQNGGCIYTENHSNIQIKGTCKLIFNNSIVYSGAGGAVYCSENSGISFKVSSKVMFHKNIVYNGEGGAICCESNSVVLFEGRSNVVFDNNKATDGGAANLFLNSSVIIRNNAFVIFHNNSATIGGAINFYVNSNGTFDINSTLVLRGNNASKNGGAVHLEGRSYINFRRILKAQFVNNKAILGGAIYCSENSYITFLNLSNTILSGNNAERGGAIFATVSKVLLNNSSVIFKNNTASQNGGAIYLDGQSNLTFTRGCNITFSCNAANDYGGAIYGKLDQTKVDFNATNILFHNNNAGTTGSSVYLNLPNQCNSVCLTDSGLDITTKSKYSGYIVTSPNKIQLYHSKIKCINYTNDTGCNSYYISNIMLGQKIYLDACMYDYYDQPVDTARFLISGADNQGYILSSNNTLISCNHTIELVSIYGNKSLPFNYSINLTLYNNHQSESKEVFTNLLVDLSACHPGFCFHEMSKKCECYNSSDIVFCFGSSSTIKRGYWYGSVTGKSTVTFCPNNYCNFTCCETSNGYFHLSPVRNNQCRSHRTGAACGSCTDGYTLSFDSTECVSVEKCTAGQMVLVILLTVIYWIVMFALVFVVMYYKIGIGYLYSITYYYSMVDILLGHNFQGSSGLYLTVSIVSSLSKITPQFLGELCLTPGMSGIDQQFIHYIHPSAIILMLATTSLLARISLKVSAIISRGIIHVICLLLLLSYTSITSTSLLLMRSLKFVNVDEIYTYLSPDIEYFHGRHLGYGIVALLCIVSIVISLPLLLTLEPFLNHKINFTKIKPLLDQFQGCYKDKYRCFAGYYMLCRLVIITIVIANSSNDFIASYMLITVCGIIALIHVTVKPYNSELLNKADGAVLQLIIFIAALPLFNDFDSPLVITVAFMLVILPLLNFVAITLFLHKNDLIKIVMHITHFTLKDKSSSNNDIDNQHSPMKEFHFIVDDNMRKNATICDINQRDFYAGSNSYRESFLEALNDIQD